MKNNNEEIKILKQRCRMDFNNYLIKLFRKDKCESCGCEENLHVHHCTSFESLFNDTYNKIGIKDDKLFREAMLGKQLKIEYITLCDKCHTNLHKEIGYSDINNLSHNKEIKKIQRKQYEEEVLKPYLKSIIGKKLYKEDRIILINKIDLKDSLGRQQKSIGCLNSYLIENFNTQIISKRIRIDNDRKTFWVLSTTNK